MAATPSPNYNDQQILAGDPTFQNRVRQSLIFYCTTVSAESPTTVPFHRERGTFAVAVMNQPDVYKVIISQAVAINGSVIGDATVAGATPLTSGNVAAQAALVTDAHIDAVIALIFNSFFRTPSN
jgi:hypothetical protein